MRINPISDGEIMIIRQIIISGFDEFCYIVGSETSGTGAVIDPGGKAEIIAEEAEKAGIRIEYIFHTHGHIDHTAGTGRLKELTGARVVRHRLEGGEGRVDILLDGEKNFTVGDIVFTIFHTPGHTPGGICLYAGGNLFTGDTLFVGDSGRTDLPGSDRSALGRSLRDLMELPDDTVVWPGHDYGPTPNSTIAWEKRNNVNAREYGFYRGD
ncbi:MAG TPA: MBL fold metallo-hydrolase [Spirochaetota bacterium]|nr:MBL fold metallo-hydrolase [Spirochaetota bacterium]